MGGLYFWVCKMVPGKPVLGCESVLCLIRPFHDERNQFVQDGRIQLL